MRQFNLNIFIKIFFLFITLCTTLTLNAKSVSTSEVKINIEREKIFIEDLNLIKERSLILNSSQVKLKSLEESKLASQMFWTPKLDLMATQEQISTKVLNQSAQFSNSSSVGITGTLNLFKSGADWRLMQGKTFDYQAGEVDLKLTEIKIEQKISSAIFQSLYLDEILKTTEKLVQLREESQKIIEAKYKQGVIPLQEVMKAQVDQSQQKTRMRAIQSDILDSQVELKSLFIQILKSKQWPLTTEVQLKKRSSSENLEVKKIEFESLALEKYWQVSQSSHLPTLDFVGTLQESPLNERNTQQWTASLQLTIPLWNRYETSAAISSSFTQYTIAKNNFAEIKEKAKAESDVIFKKFELHKINLKEALETLNKSEKLYHDMLKSYNLGRLSTNELLIEQNRLIESQMNLSRSQLDFHNAVVAVCAFNGLMLEDCLQ